MKLTPDRVPMAVSSVIMRNYLKPERNRRTNMAVTGFPKSGTTWVSQLASSCLNLTYKRNTVPLRLSNTLIHTHSVAFQGRRNILYVTRDPREVICSAGRWIKGPWREKAFDSDGKLDHEFAALVLDDFPGATVGYKEHLETAIEKDWLFIRFEDLKSDAVGTLVKYFAHKGDPVPEAKIREAVDAFDFAAMRSQAPDDKFLSQSSVASWKSKLRPETLELVAAELGQTARHFGYDLSAGEG